MWLLLSFLTAALTSTQDILAKRLSGNASPYLIAFGWVFFSLPILGLALLGEHGVVLGSNFWLVLVVDALTLTLSSVCLFKAIQAGDLSETVPLLSLTPIFLLVTSPIMVHEFPSPHGLLGIVLIVAGSWMLYYRRGDVTLRETIQRMMKAKSLRYMLIVTVVFSIGGNFDKIGVLASSPVVWSFSLNATTAFFLGILLLMKLPRGKVRLEANWSLLFFLGCAMALMMIVQMNALVLSKVPYVIAVKRTSVIMSSLWGVWFLKEESGPQRIIAALVMIAGVFVISFAQ
jgi:uncharacterized membrane protein